MVIYASAHIEKYKYIESILKQNNSPLGAVEHELGWPAIP